jgi:hypothetical protein
MLQFVFYVCKYVMYNVYFSISSFLFYSLWWMYRLNIQLPRSASRKFGALLVLFPSGQ